MLTTAMVGVFFLIRLGREDRVALALAPWHRTFPSKGDRSATPCANTVGARSRQLTPTLWTSVRALSRGPQIRLDRPTRTSGPQGWKPEVADEASGAGALAASRAAGLS